MKPQQLHPQSPKYSAGIAAEGWIEIAEGARRLMVFAEQELLASMKSGDLRRLRTLQGVHEDARRVMAQGRKHAAWSDGCADGVAEPGHGKAA